MHPAVSGKKNSTNSNVNMATLAKIRNVLLAPSLVSRVRNVAPTMKFAK